MSSNPVPLFPQVSFPQDEQNTPTEHDGGNQQPPVKERRQHSTIEFPYGDLEDAIKIARVTFDRGGGATDTSHLSAWLGHQTADGGTFRVRLSTARMFGLIRTEQKRITLTPLGEQIVDPDKERQARAEAFLQVSLYNSLYWKYDGKMLPPGDGLEEVMVDMGVAYKQKDKARQAFQRSAAQAGFFELGNNRLIAPTGVAPAATATHEAAEPPRDAPASSQATRSQNRSSGGSNNGGGGIRELQPHPLVRAAMQTLPPEGETWDNAQLKRWLKNLEGVLRMAYDVEDEGYE